MILAEHNRCMSGANFKTLGACNQGLLRHIVLDARCVQIGPGGGGGEKFFYLGGKSKAKFVFKRPTTEGGL
jgi:hypothetical protein